MPALILVEAAIGLLPVLIFLGVLFYFDSYRLTGLGAILQLLAAGALLGGAALAVNGYLLQHFAIDFSSYSRFRAPLVEESLKAAAVVWLFARNRVGFMIDAAIMGFAIGTGFGLFENMYFLFIFRDANVGVWIIRGFGTALMHGGATAFFAMLSQRFVERRGQFHPVFFLPGLVAAVAVHTVYNLLSPAPLLATIAVLVGLPPLFLLVFTKSNHAVHQWLLDDQKSHQQLLDDIASGQFTHGEAGRFLLALSEKLEPAIVADIFEYLRLHTILVLCAERLSLARETGGTPVPRQEYWQDLLRLHVLERRIGSATMMALWPHLHFSRRELWEIHHIT